MNNKKAVLGISTLVKGVIAIIVLLFLVSTFMRLFTTVSEDVFQLTEKKIKEFSYLGGSYIHPGLPAEIKDFWYQGFKEFVQAGMLPTEEENYCLGSFYIDRRWNLKGVRISFVQKPSGIHMFLRDSKGVVGAYDNDTFVNTPNLNWSLCIVDKAGVINDKLKNEFNNERHGDFALQDHNIKETEVISFSIKGKKDGTIGTDAIYYTDESLEQDNKPESFLYEGYKIIGDQAFLNKDYDRVLFFYVITGDHFCLVPTSRGSDSESFVIGSHSASGELHKLFYDKLKDPVDLDKFSTFCSLPQNKESVFKGYKSCYYFGCSDLHAMSAANHYDYPTNQGIEKSLCHSVFNRCQGLCYAKNSFSCETCQAVKKCSDYDNPDKSCIPGTTETCAIGCTYNIDTKDCEPAG